MKQVLRTIGIITVLFAVFVAGNSAKASQTEIVLTKKETEEGLNRYENGMGVGFETNISDGDVEAFMAIFDFDDGVVWKLIKDGQTIPYTEREFVTDAGSYSLLVTFDQMPEAYASFQFRITSDVINDYGSFDFGEVLENPDMTVTFDETEQMFCYRLPNGSAFYSSVPQGGIAAMNAGFSFTPDYTVTVKKDGSSYTTDASYFFTEPGMYELRIVRTTSYESTETDNNTYIITFRFRLITGSVSSLTIINAPEDFIIREVALNGQVQKQESSSYHWLAADGIYECIFTGAEDASLFYSLSFRKDTTAPFLDFSEGAFTGEATMVTYTPTEEATQIIVMRDGEFFNPAANTLATEGRYRITVSDSAGNVRTYVLNLQQDIQIFDHRMVILLVLVLVGLGGYLVYIRRTMRVL